MACSFAASRLIFHEEEEVALTIDPSWGRMAMAYGYDPSRTQTETFHVSPA